MSDVFTDRQIDLVILGACLAGDGQTEDQLVKVYEEAKRMRLEATLLDMVLTGKIFMFANDDDEMAFRGAEPEEFSNIQAMLDSKHAG